VTSEHESAPNDPGEVLGAVVLWFVAIGALVYTVQAFVGWAPFYYFPLEGECPKGLSWSKCGDMVTMKYYGRVAFSLAVSILSLLVVIPAVRKLLGGSRRSGLKIGVRAGGWLILFGCMLGIGIHEVDRWML
jgi:hypothetical protein